MTIAVADCFPLQFAIKQAEAVRGFLEGRPPERVAETLVDVIQAAIQIGEKLPGDLRKTLRQLNPPEGSWMTVQQYEDERNAVLHLFRTVREAMEDARIAAEAARARTGQAPDELSHLLDLIEATRRKEEELFRHWGSFREPRPAPDPATALPVEEAFAEIMGITVEQLREKVAEHKRRYYGAGGAKS